MGGATRARWNSAAKFANAVRTLVAQIRSEFFLAGFVLSPIRRGCSRSLGGGSLCSTRRPPFLPKGAKGTQR